MPHRYLGKKAQEIETRQTKPGYYYLFRVPIDQRQPPTKQPNPQSPSDQQVIARTHASYGS
jgi:hypothetical protein